MILWFSGIRSFNSHALFVKGETGNYNMFVKYDILNVMALQTRSGMSIREVQFSAL